MKLESSHQDSYFTPITKGAWYAQTRAGAVPEYLNLEAGTWKVTRRVQSPTHTARWEVTCLVCGTTKQTATNNIKNELAGKASKCIGACPKCSATAAASSFHADIPLRHQAVFDQYDLRL